MNMPTRRNGFYSVRLILAVTVVFTGMMTLGCENSDNHNNNIRIVTFEADATPLLGTPLSGAPARMIQDSLAVKGVVLLSDELPIVLCSVDWIGIGNGGLDDWRHALADAAGTSPERVTVHAVHQHDAPGHDSDAELLLLSQGVQGQDVINSDFAREAIRRTTRAIRTGLENPTAITHIGFGKARVDSVASNRRLLGRDGNVKYVRFSHTEGRPELRELDEGLIDPFVRLISFWNDSEAVAALTYYATHPQSYYGDGEVSYDFVGMARENRELDTGIFHVHFNGAGGNIGAGKYNDRSRENRQVLARRLADGMHRAWDNVEREPVSSTDIGWDIEPVILPVSPNLEEQSLIGEMNENPSRGLARRLAFVHRMNSGIPIILSTLRLGDARVLHMPGELFVEYQLAAESMRPNQFTAMAAYGDYGPGYIGTRESYPRGGYEVGSPSKVAPGVEDVLTEGMRKLLNVGSDTGMNPSEFFGQKPIFD